MPPTEKHGRVHTSTVTVAVLPVPSDTALVVPDRDLEWKTTRGSGAGGQHRNTTDSAVQLTHLPSGLSVRCESERSQHQNKRAALGHLRSLLHARARDAREANHNASRRSQIGSGQRGDKRRTVRLQADQVVDHVTGRRIRARAYLRGEIEGLLE